MSIISPDVRLSCGATTASVNLPILGGCWNASTITSSIHVKYNVTKEESYHNPPIPAWIDPESTRPYEQFTPFCVPAFTCGDGINGFNWCYPDTDDSYYQPAPAGSSSFIVGKFHNNYSQSNDTTSVDCGRALGFKNVYAKKTWSGRKSYTSPDWGKPTDWDWCCDGCQYTDVLPIDTTKYLTLTANSVYRDTVKYWCRTRDPEPPVDQWCCDVDGNVITCPGEGCVGGCGDTYCWVSTLMGETVREGFADATTTVDTHGNITVATCNSSSNIDTISSYGCSENTPCDEECVTSNGKIYAEAALNMLGAANTSWNEIITVFCGYVTSISTAVGCNPDVADHTGEGSWHLQWHTGTNTGPLGECIGPSDIVMDSPPCGDPPAGTKQLLWDINITPTKLEIIKYDQQWDSEWCTNETHHSSWVEVRHDVYEFSATAFYITTDTFPKDIQYNSGAYHHTELTAALSNAYTAGQVHDSLVNALLSTWDIGSDAEYPWRTDGEVTVGPMICYDEGTNAPSVPLCQTSSQYSGQLRGAPGPVGIDKVWDAAHENYCVCQDPNSPGCYSIYIDSYGGWSTQCHVPRATAWTNYFESNNFPQGAFIGANFMSTMPDTCNQAGPNKLFNDTLYACKYAEAIFPKQSFNYARPCGADRLQISESIYRCISNITDDVLTLEPSGQSIAGIINTNDLIWVCGTTTLDGLWTGSVDSGYQITLTEPRLASSSLFPEQPIPACGSGIVYLLRNQTFNSPLCGRTDIVSAAGNPVTCSLGDNTYLIDNDTVTITGATGMTVLNGTHTIKVLNNNTVVLTGVSGSPAYTGNGQMYSPLGADWKYNSVEGVNDFSIKRWTFNYRDVAEYYRISASVVWNSGLPTCDGTGVCEMMPVVPTNPRYQQTLCGLDQNVMTVECTTSCVPFNHCAAGVAYFSPNSESFSSTSGKNFWNAPAIGYEVDSLYGNMWQGAVVQAMNDPYYVTPPCPCEMDDYGQYTCIEAWTMDDGTCTPDDLMNSIAYYPAVDTFESRCEVPPGFPSMSYGVHLGCLTGSFTDCNAGNICNAPTAPQTFPLTDTCNPYLVNYYAIPWLTLLAKESCVCADPQGRWADVYMRNGVDCPIIVSPP